MSEPVTYNNYLPICSVPQNCIISKFMNFAPRDSFHGYHELYLYQVHFKIKHIWLDGLQLKWKLENDIKHRPFFYLLPAFMNFFCHLVSMATNAFYSFFSFIWVRHYFNTEKIKRHGRWCCYNQIKLNFTDILAVAKEWLFHEIPWQPLFHWRKNRCFAPGRPDVSYIIELNHMLHKNLLFQASNANCSHFK